MKFTDFSPPSTPTREQQRDALQKGLGRALQWALAGKLDAGPLLAECLRRDQYYPAPIDDPRGDWLWRMIQALDAANCFRERILRALNELLDDLSLDQLCELARLYAESGDNAFRTRLYEIVETKPVADEPRLGDDEILRLDGEKAFIVLARKRGIELENRPWEWNDTCFVDSVVDRCGEESVSRIFEQATDDATLRFRDGWDQAKNKLERESGLFWRDRVRALRDDVGEGLVEAFRGTSRSWVEKSRSISVDEVIAAAESDNAQTISFRSWGIHAEPADLEKVLDRLGTATEPQTLANLLRVFSNRTLPRFDPRILELCRHGDAAVRERACHAAEENVHPLIREFALGEAAKGVIDESVVRLFIKNFEPGDEQRILDCIELSEDTWDLHQLLHGVIHVLEENSNADASKLGLVVYACTPCGDCRFRGARVLHQRQVAPAWLIEECRFDAEKKTRKLPEEVE